MKKATVLGWYGNDNVGDDSYVHTFPLVFPGHDLSFSDSLSGDLGSCVILGGGNVVSESFLNQLKKTPKDLKKYSFSVSVTGKENFKDLKELFEMMFVRDFSSLGKLMAEGVPAAFLPDFAFMMEPDRNAGEKTIKELFSRNGHELYQKRVAVIVNSYLAPKQEQLARDHCAFEKVAWELTRILDNTPASFVFVPFGSRSPADDRASNSWVYSRCKYFKKNAMVYEKLTPQQTLDVIAAVDAVISSRLHSSIFSCIAGRPFIDLTHHDKNKVFLESIHRQDWSVSYWEFDRSKVTGLLGDFLFNPTTSQAAKHLREVSRNYKLMLSGVHKYVRLD